MGLSAGAAGDWPAHRGDNRRSGATAEAVGVPLALQWVFRSPRAPTPAWPMPAEELPRTHADNGHHVVVSGGVAYFGSSVDDHVYAIDLAGGKIRWRFAAEGPVRFAPAVAGGRVYFGSDDGYVYALDAEAGTLVWRYRVGPNTSKVLGNERMISTWPIRTSVLVDDGKVFATAGVFPFEGIYLCCLNAADGAVLWRNDAVGGRSHELPFGGLSPQGYLVASDSILYVPSGRATPAGFDRKTGRMLFYDRPSGKHGGTWALLEGERLIAGVDSSGQPRKTAYDPKTGKRRGDPFTWVRGGIDMAMAPDACHVVTRGGIETIDRWAYAAARKRIQQAQAKLAALDAAISAAEANWSFPKTIPLPDVYISDLKPIRATVGWGELTPDKSIQGKTLTIAGKTYPKGMGTHAVSELTYALKPGYRLFVATVGIDDEIGQRGSAVFRVAIDGRDVFKTARMAGPQGHWNIHVVIPPGSKRISLFADDGGDNNRYDHANWAAAGFVTRATKPIRPEPPQPDSAEKIRRLQGRRPAIVKSLNDAKAVRRVKRFAKAGLVSVIRAGGTVFAGGDGFVVAVDAETHKTLWTGKINGEAVSLAAAGERLLVSTNGGAVYCFGRREPEVVRNIVPSRWAVDPMPGGDAKAHAAAAERIVAATGITKGYALVGDCETGGLAIALAKHTKLKIIALQSDPAKLTAVRQVVEAAGLLGDRVAVEPWRASDLPDYFANLIVSEAKLFAAPAPLPADRARLLRPGGGTAVTVERRGGSMTVRETVRPPLKGGGSWRGLYADGQNTASSGDRRLKGPLGVLWYGQPGPRGMVERHARAMSPLAMDGRLFIQGEETLSACDIYNGTLLWERHIGGAVRVRVDVDGGNIVGADSGLYLATHDVAHRLDPATGKTLRTYELPASDGGARRWGYLAVEGDILLGTTVKPLAQKYAAAWRALQKAQRDRRRGIPIPVGPDGEFPAPLPPANEDTRMAMQRGGQMWREMGRFPSWRSWPAPRKGTVMAPMAGDSLFAADIETGKLLWRHRAEQIANICIAVADGVTYLAQRADADDRRQAAAEKRKMMDSGVYAGDGDGVTRPTDVRRIVAIDNATGGVLWRRAVDFTGCGGSKLGLAVRDGLLVFFGHFSNHDTGYFKENQLKWRRITVLSGADGAMTWSRPLNYLRRPLIVGETIVIEPRACDLRTGKIKMRRHPVTGRPVPWEFLRPGHSCGVASASADAIYYRSYCGATAGLTEDTGVSLLGAIRPGCWINMIPAGGVMLMPEASSGCTCSFPIRCSMALIAKPARRVDDGALFIATGPATPVAALAVNFGATGDVREPNGKVWLAYPRPKAVSGVGYGPYGVKLGMTHKAIDGMGFFARDFRRDAAGADRAWLTASGCVGLLRCDVPLADGPSAKPVRYLLRLGFAAPKGDAPGRRVFNVKVQGKTVLTRLDVAKQASAPGATLVKEIRVQADRKLSVELVPLASEITRDNAPILNFMEIIRTAAKP